MQAQVDVQLAALWRQPEWYQAQTLVERLHHTGAQEGRVEDLHRGLKRLRRWKSLKAFEGGQVFERRLQTAGITEEELLALLCETNETLAHRTPPAWLASWQQELIEAFRSHTDEQDGQQVRSLLQRIDSHNEQPILSLLQPFIPLLQRAVIRLQQHIQLLTERYTHPVLDQEAVLTSCFEALISKIIPKLSRTLILEMHVARLQEQLEGGTEHARFQSYLDQLTKQGAIIPLLAEYPVLARALVGFVRDWEYTCGELLERLCHDWPELNRQFLTGKDSGHLCSISLGAGDTHRQGRSVSVLAWSSGFRLVYKPKSLTLDVHFQQLLDWLNSHSGLTPLRIPGVLDCGDYGWSEYVSAASCTTEEEIERFYERQGASLALLYILGATDFHHENIIASGEYPFLVDLECLFQTRKRSPLAEQERQTITHFLLDSVLSVGILPERRYANSQDAGIDLSGLGGQGDQKFPLALPTWQDIGTDHMHLEKRYHLIDESANRPKLHGQDVSLLAYRDPLVHGFTRMYQLIMQKRDILVQEFLPRFASDPIRVLLRSTQYYSSVLNGSFYPNLLRNALQRERFLDMLWLGIEQDERFSRTIPIEREELIRGDIPLFTSYADSRDLYSSSGQQIAEFLYTSGLQEVKERLQRLSEEDLAQQRWIIDASLACADTTTSIDIDFKEVHLPTQGTPLAPSRLLALAEQIGEELSNSALRLHDQAGWFAIQYKNDEAWHLSPTSIDLYNGTPGIIFFLAYLATLTGEERYRTLAQAALVNLRAELVQQLKYPALLSIGAFSGLGSVIYLFSHLGVLWQDPGLFVEAEKLVDVLANHIDSDQNFDITSGAAGAILSLLSLHNASGSNAAYRAAIRCGDHLLRSALDLPVGKGWKNDVGIEPLSGFSHGAAGIALSLFKLAQYTQEPRFQTLTGAALAYERSLFSQERQNWLTLRTEAEGPRYMVAWCHGAPGIGLARLGMLPAHEDLDILPDIEAALQTTETAFGGNHSLCHGGFGNLEVLLVVSQRLPQVYPTERMLRIAHWLVQDLEDRGWQTGLHFNMQTPSLMVGGSGIGYQLLRLAAPESVPSLLLLEPPVRTARPY